MNYWCNGKFLKCQTKLPYNAETPLESIYIAKRTEKTLHKTPCVGIVVVLSEIDPKWKLGCLSGNE